MPDDNGGAIAFGLTEGPFLTSPNPNAETLYWSADISITGVVAPTARVSLSGSTTEIVDSVATRVGDYVWGGATDFPSSSSQGGLDAVTLRRSGNLFGLNLWGTADDDEATCFGWAAGRDQGFAAGTTKALGTNTLLDVWVSRVSGSGAMIWQRSYGPAELARVVSITGDGSGGFYFVAVAANPAIPMLLRRHDHQGNRIWTVPLDPAVSVVDIQEDGSGGVHLAGTILQDPGSPSSDPDVWLARYDGAGNELWATQFGSSVRDEAVQIMFDLHGDLVVAGNTEGSIGGPVGHQGGLDVWVAQLDPNTGTRLWTRQLGSAADDTLEGVAFDGQGGVFLAGGTSGDLAGPSMGMQDGWIARVDRGLEFSRYCQVPIPNSTGLPGRLDATGNNTVSANSLALRALQLPPSTFGIFVTSQTQGFTPFAGGSQGHLCLAGFIGRFSAPGQILGSGPDGTFTLNVDLTAIPISTAFVSAAAGDLWHFQAWHRDLNPTPTSNYTEALSILFR